MRASIIIVLVFAAGIVAATSENPNFSRDVKCNTKPQGILDFVPENTQNGYFFGKRQSVVAAPMMNKYERILSKLLRYFPAGMPMKWLCQKMKTNPAFTEELRRRLIDGRVDFTSIIRPTQRID